MPGPMHPSPSDDEARGASLLLTGMGGVLGWGVARALAGLRGECRLLGRMRPSAWRGCGFEQMELEAGARSPRSLARLIRRHRPDRVVHAAGDTRWDRCEADPEHAERVNAGATREAAEAAREVGARMLFVSTDQVFDGRAASYDERAAPRPLHAYGMTKARGEDAALVLGQAVARLPLLLGPEVGPDRRGADAALLAALRRGDRPRLFVDEWRSPAGVIPVGRAIRSWLERPLPGVFHFAGAEALTRHALGERICKAAGVKPEFDAGRAAGLETGPGAAPRPRRLVLTSGRAARELHWSAPDLRQSLAHLTESRR